MSQKPRSLQPLVRPALVESRWDWLVASTSKALPCGRVTVSLRLLDEVCQNAAVLHAWNGQKRAEALALAIGACFEIHHDSVILWPPPAGESAQPTKVTSKRISGSTLSVTF